MHVRIYTQVYEKNTKENWTLLNPHFLISSKWNSSPLVFSLSFSFFKGIYYYYCFVCHVRITILSLSCKWLPYQVMGMVTKWVPQGYYLEASKRSVEWFHQQGVVQGCHSTKMGHNKILLDFSWLLKCFMSLTCLLETWHQI